MMKCSAAIPVMLLLCLTAIKPADCQQTESSQIRPSQAGVIELQAPPKEETPQENLLDYFNAFAQQLDRLADGQLSNVPKLDENSVLYLNAVYLFCSLRKGACPWILEALLETDIVNSRLNKSPDCPQMRSFWKLWGKNDLQRRHDYQIQTALMRQTMQFRKNELPRYVYCTKTVTTELKLEDKKLSDAQYFKARYGAESNPKKSVAELISLIKAIKAKHIDVFASANIAVKSEPSAPTKNTKSRSSTRRKR